MGKKTLYDNVITNLKSNWLIVLFILLFMIATFVGALFFAINQMEVFWTGDFIPKEISKDEKLSGDEKLKVDTLQISQDLLNFVLERQKEEPQIDPSRWQESINLQIKYSEETQNIYYRDYSPKIIFIRSEFLRRGMADNELDQFYERPTNYIGLQIVGTKLATLAYQLN